MYDTLIRKNASQLKNLDYKHNKFALETSLVREALRRTNNNVTHAAALLALPRAQVYRLMKRCFGGYPESQ